MSDTVVIALVSGLPAILAAVGTFINMFLHKSTDDKINQLEKNTNGLQDNLLKVSGQLQYRKGQEGTISGFPEIKEEK